MFARMYSAYFCLWWCVVNHCSYKMWGSHNNVLGITIFWDVTPYNLVGVYWDSGGTWCLLQDRWNIPEDGGRKYLWKVSKYLQDFTTLCLWMTVICKLYYPVQPFHSVWVPNVTVKLARFLLCVWGVLGSNLSIGISYLDWIFLCLVSRQVSSEYHNLCHNCLLPHTG